MKKKSLILATLILLIVFFVVKDGIIEIRRAANVLTLPSLPKPIADQYALITSAGQNSDVYIIGDIANKFMIHNYFMPRANEGNLEGIGTVVFVVGYSPVGEKLQRTSYENEKKRLIELTKKIKEQDIAVITIYIGGYQQRNSKTDELLKLVGHDTDYLIGTKEANQDGFFSELAKDNNIPLTLIKGVEDLSEPFTSAFR